MILDLRCRKTNKVHYIKLSQYSHWSTSSSDLKSHPYLHKHTSKHTHSRTPDPLPLQSNDECSISKYILGKKDTPFAPVWYEIGVLWTNITHIKSYTTAFGFWLQTGMNQIFQISYIVHCCSLRGYKNIWGQSSRSNEKLLTQPNLNLGLAEPTDFLWTSNFDLWYFCSPLTYKNVQYLI